MSLELILKDIDDRYVRENFLRISRFIEDQVILNGQWKFYKVEVTSAVTNFKFKHNLNFIPSHIIPLSQNGDKRIDFRYDLFTRDHIVFTTQGAACFSFLAGRYDAICDQKDMTQVSLTTSPISGGTVITGNVVLPAGMTTDVDTILLTSVGCLEYDICLTEQGGSQRKKYRFSVVNSSSGLKDSLYGRMGDNLNVSISATSSGGNYFLRFVNNEAFNVVLDYYRIA